MPKACDLSGQKFNRLTAIDCERKRQPSGRAYLHWRCSCECGNETSLTADQLRSGAVKSCGCLHRERTSLANTRHGLSGSRVYKIWHGMIVRCTKTYATMYHAYGARGITVCDRWLNSFEAFLEDMGHPPSDLHSIDRYPDRDGNYEPGNTRWATDGEQSNNTNRNHFIEYGGESLTMAQWARRVGIRPRLLEARIGRLGWTIERALTEPPDPARQAGHARRKSR